MQAVESGLTLNPLIKVLSLHQRALRHAVSSAERAALGYSEETELRWLEDAFVEVIDEEEREIHVKKDMKMRGHISHQTSFLLLVKTENSHPVNGLLISLHLCVCARTCAVRWMWLCGGETHSVWLFASLPMHVRAILTYSHADLPLEAR